MKGRLETPELDQAIDAHARAIVAGNLDAAGAFVSPGAREAHRELAAQFIGGGALEGFELPGRAKIGFQYMSRVRFLRGAQTLLALIRWRLEDGRWMIASVEDMSNKRSAWSDIEPPPPYAGSAARTENGRG